MVSGVFRFLGIVRGYRGYLGGFIGGLIYSYGRRIIEYNFFKLKKRRFSCSL